MVNFCSLGYESSVLIDAKPIVLVLIYSKFFPHNHIQKLSDGNFRNPTPCMTRAVSLSSEGRNLVKGGGRRVAGRVHQKANFRHRSHSLPLMSSGGLTGVVAHGKAVSTLAPFHEESKWPFRSNPEQNPRLDTKFSRANPQLAASDEKKKKEQLMKGQEMRYRRADLSLSPFFHLAKGHALILWLGEVLWQGQEAGGATRFMPHRKETQSPSMALRKQKFSPYAACYTESPSQVW